MMKYTLLFLSCLSFSLCHARPMADDGKAYPDDSISVHYGEALDKLVQARDEQLADADRQAAIVALNPYYYRLMLPGTYYSQPLRQAMQIGWQPQGEAPQAAAEEHNLSVVTASDRALAALYVAQPSLVARTETILNETPALREEVKEAPVAELPTLSEKVVAVELETDVPDTINFIPKRPKFWKVKGDASLQFTQSYFSENWYQGGENNYAGIGMLTLEANYDNQRKTQWDNKLEAQLGFQTTNSDDYHKFHVTSNLLRLTSKLGYKAAKNWFYTAQAQSYTQLAPFYEKNQQDWKANFATPLYLTLSVGMDYKYKSKNEKVELSVYLSPVAYYMTYISKFHSRHFATDDDGNPQTDGDYIKYNYWHTDTYGMEHRDDHFLHKFGPNLTVNSKIVILKNVTWTSRFYWFSNFHSTLFEWENTLDFAINKYLSAKFYAYPRFDDSSRNYKKDHGYLMFKEWLSLGLSYSW